MRKTALLLLTICAATRAQAQQDMGAFKKRMMDSIMDARMDEAALMYPRIRQFSITHQQGLAGNIRSKRHGEELFEGRFSTARTTINMNMPVMVGKKGSLISSLGVIHQFSSLNKVVNQQTEYAVAANDIYIPMLNLGMTYIRRDSLFRKPVTMTASLSGLFDPGFSQRQFLFTGTMSMPIIRRANTSLTAGFVVSLDPASPVPVFLFASYFHKFKALNADLMLDLPYRAALRKPLSNRTSVTAFSELGGSNSFFEFNSSTLPQQLTYSTLEIKSGLLLEYRLTKKAVLSFSGGLNSTATSKIIEEGKKPSDYLIKNKNSAVPYLQVGFSLLPFWKPFR